MKRYWCTLLLLVPGLSFALTPVTIYSASINYTAHTVTVVGSGFCTGALPAVTFNTTRLKVTSACSLSVVVASLPVQAAGSYRLIIANTTGASATFYVTYGAVGPQGPQGFTGATGATGATGSQGPVGLTGAQGATGAAGPQGPAGTNGTNGTNGTGFNFRNAFDPTATYAINDVATYGGSTYLANVANGPNTLTPDANTSAWVVLAQQGATGAVGADGAIGPQGPIGIGLPGATGATGAQGVQGISGTNGADGAQGPQGLSGAQGTQGIQGNPGTNGTGFNPRGTWNSATSYAANDVVSYTPTGITYNVNLTFGAAGSMVGTITTDGTQGVLSISNIVSWKLTLSDSGTNSTILTPGNSAFGSGVQDTGGLPNGDFTATPTNLTMTYSNGGFWSVAGASGQFCMTDWSNCFGPVAFGTWSINGDNQYSESPAGAGSSQIIGTGGTAATLGRSTYVATAPVAAGTVPGTLPWVMMAQAGTNGANGTNGTNGLQGPQGFPGVAGAQGSIGATGAQGTPGLNGLQGPAGLVGATGAQGLAGTNGTNGINGATGAQGAQGIPGTNGTNGTGFNPRGTWNSATSYAVNDVVSYASTGITYNVNLSFGASGSAVGTITTDGTIGVLNIPNFVSWNLTVTDHGTNSTILTQANSAFSSGTFNSSGPNQDFSATSTALLFNYAAGDAGSWSVAGASGQLCFTSYSNCFGPSNTYGTWNINGDSQFTTSGAGGSQAVGTGGATTHGGTSTYAATAPVAAGTLPGTLPWVMMAQAGTNGASGTNGTNGLQGPQGFPGVAGATGVQGLAGTNGTNGINGTNGTGFNFRNAFDPTATYAINDVVSYTPTGITYNVNLTFGAAGSMVGTITTDGTQGVLSISNIVSWKLTLSDSGTNSTILTPGNSAFGSGVQDTGGLPNGDFTATPTNLTMTYSNGGFWSVAGASGQFCMTDWSNCFGPVAFGTWSINGDNQYSESPAGAGSSQIIGTGGTAATLGRSTYVATAPVAAGTVPGTLPWVMMAQAGTPGTPGAPGINGTNGINGAPGINGLQGPQGLQGLQGAPSTVPGPQGLSGINGANGLQGPQGLQGAASTVAGPQGPQGQPGSNGTNGLNGTPGPSLAEMRAALLQWYSQTYPTGANPGAIGFDGSNLWITNYTSNVVTKMRANDGVIVGTYPTGAWSLGVAFDGANIWVANANSNTVTKLLASDGSYVGTYQVGASPSCLVFDGANIWVTNTWSNSVTVLRASDGATVGNYPTGTNPKGIAFDGANIWVTNYGSNSVTEMRVDGTAVATYYVGSGPYGAAFDGSSIWVVNNGDNTVTKLLASNGATVGTYPVGHTPYFLAFDGSNIWVTNGGDNTVTKLRASTGTNLGTYQTGARPGFLAFDGSNVWVTNDGGGVTRIGATK